MKIKIFTYKGYVAIEGNAHAGNILLTNPPQGQENLFLVFPIEDVSISDDALRIFMDSSNTAEPSKEFMEFVDELKEEGVKDS